MYKLLIAAIIPAVLISCNRNADVKKAAESAGSIPVTVLPILPGNQAAVISVSGTLGTENEARLSFKTGGVIEQVAVQEGDRVLKGQLLATLRLTEINAQVSQVELALEKARRDYQRAASLYRDSVITLEQLQNARTGLDIAQRSLEQAAFNRQYSRIYAPADGFISHKLGNAGELAAPGAPVLVMQAVSASSQWVLRCGLADKEWAALETGNPVTLRFDAFPGKTFPGTVSRKSLSADPVSGSFPVEIQVRFNNEKPAAGMFGNAVIRAAEPLPGFAVPYEALLEINGNKGYVFVTDDSITVKRVQVNIASISQEMAWISSGLEGHPLLVTGGSPYLTDGTHIIIQQ